MSTHDMVQYVTFQNETIAEMNAMCIYYRSLVTVILHKCLLLVRLLQYQWWRGTSLSWYCVPVLKLWKLNYFLAFGSKFSWQVVSVESMHCLECLWIDKNSNLDKQRNYFTRHERELWIPKPLFSRVQTDMLMHCGQVKNWKTLVKRRLRKRCSRYSSSTWFEEWMYKPTFTRTIQDPKTLIILMTTSER